MQLAVHVLKRAERDSSIRVMTVEKSRVSIRRILDLSKVLLTGKLSLQGVLSGAMYCYDLEWLCFENIKRVGNGKGNLSR